ncbi:membrane-associated tyrosine- and threonine-specific cdc2-inhibitory kinase isoform X2 [Rhinatrema bivittatum]|uniref:membrane-associated tyrosine- and threonine-specific cdc2-inhibitory kinase isoform X2 n=1 Tax=Rhinatrema bivittatum TaxID=194408 RepID=UPI001125B70B|nr:membrane-associated tyrosine- and threonine-specific cdc2-inhibitory kinase isoform X2 [Rhinatrema bivittatum]
MPLPPDAMGDSSLSRTPIPVPAYFKQAESSFSRKRQGRPLCYTLPPRPPAKSAPPISRLFPHRHQSWSQPRPQSVSFRSPERQPLHSRLYDESRRELFFEQCFQRICKLGRGSFGEVYKVRSREDGQLYAVKRSMEHFRGESDRQRKLAEVQKHERVGWHPNLVRFVQAWEEKRQLYIQTELCEASLQQHCEEQGPLPERQVWAFLCDLLHGLHHLHQRDLLHMDIKPANIFLSSHSTCKLGDFGLMLELGRGSLSDAQEGDPRYMAPELLDGEYTKAADIFSLGMSILEIACNMDLPKGGESWQQLRQGYLPPEFTAGLSPELLNVLTTMLEPDHRKRATVENLLTSPVLRRVAMWRRLMLTTQWLLSFLLVLWLGITWPAHWFLSCWSSPRMAPSSPASTPTQLIDSSISSDWEDDSLGDDVFDLPVKAFSPGFLPCALSYHEDIDTGDLQTLNNVRNSPEVLTCPSLGSTSTPRNPSPEYSIRRRKRCESLSSGALMNPENQLHGVCNSLLSSSSRAESLCHKVIFLCRSPGRFRSLCTSPNISHISQESPCSHKTSSPSTCHASGFVEEDCQHAFEPKNLLSMFENVSLERD